MDGALNGRLLRAKISLIHYTALQGLDNAKFDSGTTAAHRE